jgi:predicted DNA-binding transcriptional regulator YafY
MSMLKYVEKLRRIDLLIARRSTGTPREFADKLEIKRSTLFQYLQEMREMGVDIRYSHLLRSYYYADGNRIAIRIEPIEIMQGNNINN